MFYTNWEVTWAHYTIRHQKFDGIPEIANSDFGQYLRHQIADTLRKTHLIFNSQSDKENLFWGLNPARYDTEKSWGRFRSLPQIALSERFDFIDYTSEGYIVPDPEMTPNEPFKPQGYGLVTYGRNTYLKIFRRANFPHRNEDSILIFFPTPLAEHWEDFLSHERGNIIPEIPILNWLANNYHHRWTFQSGLNSFFHTKPHAAGSWLNLHPLANPCYQHRYRDAFPKMNAELVDFLKGNREDYFHWLVFADWLEERNLERPLCELIRFFIGDTPIAF